MKESNKFKLWLGCLGNGVTVCNKAVTESGDFKHIAHISEYGTIKLYVKPGYIPAADMQKIQAVADANRITFEKMLKTYKEVDVYERLLDMVPLSIFLEVMKISGGISAKIDYLKKYLYTEG